MPQAEPTPLASSTLPAPGHRAAAESGPAPGHVWLVGAGPGDPGLLTLRAARALATAELILHDALPGPAVLELANPEAVLIDVGKRKGHAPWKQAAINARLLSAARAGRRVVRLKGGDPFIFGRGGEEALALAEAGIPWRVVPGVSAGLAAPALAGIPLTHRGLAGAVTFLTGHDAAGNLPQEAALAGTGTLVAFMALSRLDALVLAALAAGRDPATPLSVIARAGLPGERILRTTLGQATLAARRARLPAPALVVIGAVAGITPLHQPIDPAAAAPA